MFSIIRPRRHFVYRLSRLVSSSRFFQNSCPSCSQPLTSSLPVCVKCGHISHLPQGIKYHDVFDLPYEPNPFVIDIATLKQRFRSAQALCHPDNWAAKGPSKHDIAQSLSARINEAYQCLLNPLSRAEYILKRRQILITEKDQVDDSKFMAIVMEARESIEYAEDQREVERLLNENASVIKSTEQELERFVGEGRWNDVKSAAVRLRYFQGIDIAGRKWLLGGEGRTSSLA